MCASSALDHLFFGIASVSLGTVGWVCCLSEYHNCCFCCFNSCLCYDLCHALFRCHSFLLSFRLPYSNLSTLCLLVYLVGGFFVLLLIQHNVLTFKEDSTTGSFELYHALCILSVIWIPTYFYTSMHIYIYGMYR